MSGDSTPTSVPGVSLPNWSPPGGSGPSLQQQFSSQIAGKPQPSATPTQENANTTALQKQLASESAARLYGTTLTSGAGLLDTPTTTSRILLGS